MKQFRRRTRQPPRRAPSLHEVSARLQTVFHLWPHRRNSFHRMRLRQALADLRYMFQRDEAAWQLAICKSIRRHDSRHAPKAERLPPDFEAHVRYGNLDKFIPPKPFAETG